MPQKRKLSRKKIKQLEIGIVSKRFGISKTKLTGFKGRMLRKKLILQ